MDPIIEILILLGVFYLTFSSLTKAFACFSNANIGLSYFEAGCCFLVISMFCASFFPMRQHLANSVATNIAKEKAIENGRVYVDNIWVESEPKLIDTLSTVVVMSVLAFGLRIGEILVKTTIPIYYSIIVFFITPFFFYHFVCWAFSR